MATPGEGTLVDWHVLFPKGNQTDVELSRDSPGPLACPSGDIISPFGSFPPPAAGKQRWIRLKAVYYDENAAGQNHVQVVFNMFSGGPVTFTLPQVASAQGASNFHYSDWYKPPINDAYAHAFAKFVSSAPYNNHAGVYSLIIEAHDI